MAMRVKELIEELSKYDEDEFVELAIWVEHYGSGCWEFGRLDSVEYDELEKEVELKAFNN